MIKPFTDMTKMSRVGKTLRAKEALERYLHKGGHRLGSIGSESFGDGGELADTNRGPVSHDLVDRIHGNAGSVRNLLMSEPASGARLVQ